MRKPMALDEKRDPAGLKSEIPTMALGPRVELINSYTGFPVGLGPGVEPLNSCTGVPGVCGVQLALGLTPEIPTGALLHRPGPGVEP